MENITLHTILKEDFLKWYKYKKGLDFYWCVKEATNLKQLIIKLKFSIKKFGKEPTDLEIQTTFQHLLKSIKDKWILENLSVSIINSKYNEIISKARNSEDGITARILSKMETSLGDKKFTED